MDRIPLFRVAMDPVAKELVGQVLDSGYIGQGPKVEEFEDALREELGYSGRPLTTSSCTAALDLAYHLCGVGPGDEVISTPITCTATNTPLVQRRARIVWSDVSQETGNVDMQDLVSKVSIHTRAIVCVDWAGRLCDYGMLRGLLKDRGLDVPIIQDAAHSYGADFSKANNRGDYTCFSFQAIKHLTTGDGGALLLPSKERKRAELLRWYGLDRTSSASFRCSQTIDEIGYKSHMNDVSAAIGLANLPLARENIEKTAKNASHLCADLRNWNLFVPNWSRNCSWWLFTLVLDPEVNRDHFVQAMDAAGIDASPVHARNDKHPQLRFWGGDLAGVDLFARQEVCIPCGWWCGEEEIDRIIEAVNGYEPVL